MVVFINGEEDHKALTLASIVSKHLGRAWEEHNGADAHQGPERRDRKARREEMTQQAHKAGPCTTEEKGVGKPGITVARAHGQR